MGQITMNSGETVSLTSVQLQYSGVSNDSACEASAATYYIPDGTTFANANVIWLNSNGSGVPANGYYSDGTHYRFWNGTNLGAYTECSFVTCDSWSAQLDDQAPSGETIEFSITLCGSPTVINKVLNPGESLNFCGNVIAITSFTGWSSPITDNNIGSYGSIVNSNVACDSGDGIAVNLKMGTNKDFVCGDNLYTNYFVQNGKNFPTADKLYSDLELITLAPSGFYREELTSNWRQWNQTTQAFVDAGTCEFVGDCKEWSISTGASTPTGEETHITGTSCSGDPIDITASAGQTITFCGTVDTIENLYNWVVGPITEDNNGDVGCRVWVSNQDCD